MRVSKRGKNVSPSKVFGDVALVKQSGRGSDPDRWSGPVASELRHKLVDAQVEVLRMYLEKQSTEQLIGALDRLIECTEASFRSEEALMECLTGHSDPLHCEAHRGVLAQLEYLRASAQDFDRGRLLAHLILVDRELTSHLWEGRGTSNGNAGQLTAKRETALHG